jgi:hypothetical protein
MGFHERLTAKREGTSGNERFIILEGLQGPLLKIRTGETDKGFNVDLDAAEVVALVDMLNRWLDRPIHER